MTRTQRSTACVVSLVLLVLVVGAAGSARAGNPIYDAVVPPMKRPTSGDLNTARNHVDWLFRHTCPAIVKHEENPAEVAEADYRDLISRLYEARHIDPQALAKLEKEKYFQGHLQRAKAADAAGYLERCTRIAHEYASGKNAKDRPLSDMCLGDRYPVWINLNLIEQYYQQWQTWKETGKGRKPLVFRSRQCLEWARQAQSINALVEHDRMLDWKVLAGKPDETSLRKVLVPSSPTKVCDTNDEFKDAFREIDPDNPQSIFSQRKKMVLEMEKDAGVAYEGVRVWYTGRKSRLADKRNRILYRLTHDAEVAGKTLKAGTLLETHSDKF